VEQSTVVAKEDDAAILTAVHTGNRPRRIVIINRRTLKALVLFAVLLFPVLSPSNIHAKASPLRVGIVSHGLMMSLSVSRQTYPLNSLVLATVIMKNVTSHPAHVPLVKAICSTVQIDVYDAKQRVVFPPTFPGAVNSVSCPLRIPTATLTAGSTRSWQIPVILRGPHLRLSMTLPFGNAPTIATSEITIHLTTSGPMPKVALHTLPRVYADLGFSQPHHGGLYFTDWIACNRGTSTVGDPWNSPWSISRSGKLVPVWSRLGPCAGQREWHVLAGYLNYPVVAINFKSP
jgi:hypothetical protein